MIPDNECAIPVFSLYLPLPPEEQQKAAQSNHSEDTESKSGRKVVKSKEEWIPRVNHVYEDIPEEGVCVGVP